MIYMDNALLVKTIGFAFADCAAQSVLNFKVDPRVFVVAVIRAVVTIGTLIIMTIYWRLMRQHMISFEND